MSSDSLSPARAPAHPPDRRRTVGRGSGWFRAVWRWHFFASFLVVPVLLLLATTGLIYLFRFQLEPLLHPALYRVDTSASGGIAQPYLSQLSAVEQAYPGSTAVSLAEPREVGDPTIVSITTADGAGRDVFVDPYRIEVLGSVDPDRTLSGYAIRLHGELMAGRWGDHVIELGACWAVVMALTGYYLFVRGW
ncbi:MAG TPA: PepSY domain-containing protein, partial [Nocardioides sp.]|nr:PepSY domain-containing protein [Nocardioides sp.]